MEMHHDVISSYHPWGIVDSDQQPMSESPVLLEPGDNAT
jgi:hypothetical protein